MGIREEVSVLQEILCKLRVLFLSVFANEEACRLGKGGDEKKQR